MKVYCEDCGEIFYEGDFPELFGEPPEWFNKACHHAMKFNHKVKAVYILFGEPIEIDIHELTQTILKYTGMDKEELLKEDEGAISK